MLGSTQGVLSKSAEHAEQNGLDLDTLLAAKLLTISAVTLSIGFCGASLIGCHRWDEAGLVYAAIGDDA